MDQVGHKLGVALAARLRSFCELSLGEGELLIRLRSGGPNATAKALQEALASLESLARELDLAQKVRLVVTEAEPSLEQKVAADPRVQAVLEVFGGKITKVEEQS